MSLRNSAARVVTAVAAVAAVGVLHVAGEAGASDDIRRNAAPRPAGPTISAVARVVPAAPAAPSQLTKGFAYAGTPDTNQRLVATWNPALIGAPWVVTVHGGSWVGGGPAGVQGAATLFRRSGFQVFNLRYRLVGSVGRHGAVTFADQRTDVLTALGWIRSHAAEFGIDPDRGALYGSSAGGNLALAAGLAGDGTNGVRAVVSVAGVVRPTLLWDAVRSHKSGERATAQMKRLAGNARRAAGCAYPPGRVAGCAARWRAMDVVNAVSPRDPAVLLFHGLADRKVPYRMAAGFRTQLDRADIGGSLVLVPGLGHTQQLALDGGRRQAAMISFVRQRTAVAAAPGLTRLSAHRLSTRVTTSTRSRFAVAVRPRVPGPAAAGVVVVTAGRATVRARLVSGRATITLSRLAVGVHRIGVRYAGSPGLQPSHTTIRVAVRRR